MPEACLKECVTKKAWAHADHLDTDVSPPENTAFANDQNSKTGLWIQSWKSNINLDIFNDPGWFMLVRASACLAGGPAYEV